MLAAHQWLHKPSFTLGADGGSKSRNTAAQRGIAYHRRVYRGLAGVAAAEQAKLLIEPWFVRVDNQPRRTMRSPDSVLLYPDEQLAIVVEVKLNWRDGRDEKLLTEYLPIVRSAFSLDTVWPLMITSCLRGYAGKPLLGLQQFTDCMAWAPGQPTPIMLLP